MTPLIGPLKIAANDDVSTKALLLIDRRVKLLLDEYLSPGMCSSLFPEVNVYKLGYKGNGTAVLRSLLGEYILYMSLVSGYTSELS